MPWSLDALNRYVEACLGAEPEPSQAELAALDHPEFELTAFNFMLVYGTAALCREAFANRRRANAPEARELDDLVRLWASRTLTWLGFGPVRFVESWYNPGPKPIALSALPYEQSGVEIYRLPGVGIYCPLGLVPAYGPDNEHWSILYAASDFHAFYNRLPLVRSSNRQPPDVPVDDSADAAPVCNDQDTVPSPYDCDEITIFDDCALAILDEYIAAMT